MGTVCKIVTKDSEGKYRRLFRIGGDQLQDASIYITLANKNWHDTYHDNEKDGLVRTHLSDMKSVSTLYQVPLQERKKAFFYTHKSPCAERLPYTTKETPDIEVTIKPEFLHYCSYLFYTDESGLYEHAGQQSLIVLHRYKIPTKNVGRINFAVMMHESFLTQIQKTDVDLGCENFP